MPFVKRKHSLRKKRSHRPHKKTHHLHKHQRGGFVISKEFDIAQMKPYFNIDKGEKSIRDYLFRAPKGTNKYEFLKPADILKIKDKMDKDPNYIPTEDTAVDYFHFITDSVKSYDDYASVGVKLYIPGSDFMKKTGMINDQIPRPSFSSIHNHIPSDINGLNYARTIRLKNSLYGSQGDTTQNY